MEIKPVPIFMTRALELAALGRGRTSPNPMVGAVVVRGGEIVGEGWHRRAGEPHAEVLALAAAGGKADGADLYVNLEPCVHHGRTPPCVGAILAAGIRRVWAAVPDPNPLVNGKGAASLREKGIPTAIHYPAPLHAQPALSSYGREGESWPRALAASREVLSLPMHPFLAAEDIDLVCRSIVEAVSE